jgi:hypothetical protein
MKTKYTLWFNPKVNVTDSLFCKLLKKYDLDLLGVEIKQLFSHSKVDSAHTNLYMISVVSKYYSRTQSIDEFDFTGDETFIDMATNKGIRCIIDYSWEASSVKNITNYKFWKRNERLIQDYDIQFLSNTSSDINHKLNSGKDFFLNFPMFSYEVRSTNATANIDYHLNTSMCLKEHKKYFFNLFIGDIDKFKNILTLASYYRRGLKESSVYSAVLGHNDNNIDTYEDRLRRHEAMFARHPIPDVNKTIEYLIQNEDDIIHKHLPFERYEGNPDFDVNSNGSGHVERKIPQIAHESHMWCVVETLSTVDILHHTEKTFKPISVGHPFMVLGAVNQNKDLKKYGYELYDDIINYDFEEPCNMASLPYRYNVIEKYFNEVERLIKEGPGIFYQKSVLEKVEWNKHNFQKQTTRDALQLELAELFA